METKRFHHTWTSPIGYVGVSWRHLLPLCLLFLVVLTARAQPRDYLQEAKAETNPDRKLELLALATTHQPSELSWFYYGVALNQQSLYKQAADAFTRGLQIPGGKYPADLNAQLAVALYYQDKITVATQKAKLALSLYDKHTTAHYVLGLCHLGNEDFEDALAAFDQYISLAPDSDYGYYLRHLACHRMKNYPCALQAIETAISKKPDHRAYLERKMLTLNAMGKQEEADKLINALIDDAEDDLISLINLGNSYFNQKSYLKALGYLNKAVEMLAVEMDMKPLFLDNNRDLAYDVYMSRGNAHLALENYSYALIDFTLARDLKPKDHMAYQRMGQLHVERENWRRAVVSYERAFQLNPTYPEGWVNFGYAMGQLGEAEQSQLVYSRALALPYVESRGLLLNNRGYTYLEWGDTIRSLQDLEAAILAEPNIPMSHISLGEYYLKVKQPDKAIHKFTHALQMQELSRRERYTAYFKRGLAYELQEKPEQALADFRLALEIDPRHAECWQKIGIQSYNVENHCEAVKHLKQAKTLSNSSDTQMMRQTLMYLHLAEKALNSPCNS